MLQNLAYVSDFICPYGAAMVRAAFGPRSGGPELRPTETTLPAMSGKRAFLELLKQEGVEIVFGNPGTTELPLMDAFAVENEIKYILGLQEAALMSMADGYAQASGKLAVLNFHVAPGLGNAMGMLYDARKAAAPILVTAGQQDTDYLATEPILSADLPTLARPFVKWAAEVHRLADLPRLVHRAAKTALAPPTGPVFLGLPGDILKAEGEVDLMGPTRIGARLRGDLAEIAKAAMLLAESKRPVIMAGDAVAQSQAFAELVELAELIGAPVYAEFVPNTASFPASHPLFRGNVIRLQAAVRKVLDEYDVLVSVGADLFTLSLPSNVDPMPPGMPLIHLDTDPWEIGKNYPATAAILGDPKSTLPELTAMVRERMTSAARGEARARLQTASEASLADRAALRAKARALAKTTPIQPLALLGAIGDLLPKDAVVIEEALSSAPGIRQLMRSDDPQSYFGLRGGGIGWGLPAAIGVKLALPHRPVVALIGDGSAMYTIQALWTAAHYCIPVVFVILNNTSYRILKQRLHALRGHAEQVDTYVGMELLDPAIDFVGLSRSLGVAAERAKTVHDATDLIGKALDDNVAMLIDVELDRAFKPM
jgi:benzoylformate decarboxylase